MADKINKMIIAESSQMSELFFDRVMARLSYERQLNLFKRRLTLAAVMFLPLTVVSILSWFNLRVEISQSGFGNYISLLFTDSKLVLSYWQDYLLTLLESMPGVSLIVVSSLSLAVILSLRNMIISFKEMKEIKLISNI